MKKKSYFKNITIFLMSKDSIDSLLQEIKETVSTIKDRVIVNILRHLILKLEKQIDKKENNITEKDIEKTRLIFKIEHITDIMIDECVNCFSDTVRCDDSPDICRICSDAFCEVCICSHKCNN